MLDAQRITQQVGAGDGGRTVSAEQECMTCGCNQGDSVGRRLRRRLRLLG